MTSVKNKSNHQLLVYLDHTEIYHDRLLNRIEPKCFRSWCTFSRSPWPPKTHSFVHCAMELGMLRDCYFSWQFINLTPGEFLPVFRQHFETTILSVLRRKMKRHRIYYIFQIKITDPLNVKEFQTSVRGIIHLHQPLSKLKMFCHCLFFTQHVQQSKVSWKESSCLAHLRWALLSGFSEWSTLKN